MQRFHNSDLTKRSRRAALRAALPALALMAALSSGAPRWGAVAPASAADMSTSAPSAALDFLLAVSVGRARMA